MAVGLAVGAALVDYGIDRGEPRPHGCRDRRSGRRTAGGRARTAADPGAVWWAVANPPAWALGWLVTSYVITKNVEEQFTNFGASGTLLFALLTSLLLAVLLRRTEPNTP